MNQRAKIANAWQRYKAAHPYSTYLQKAQAFFDYLNANPDLCWVELTVEFRRNYYDAFDEIVGTLLETDDPLIIYNATRFADFNNPKELEAAKRAIQQIDADKHQISLAALAQVPDLQPTLRAKRDLPDSVRVALSQVTPQPRRHPPPRRPPPQKGRKRG